MSGAHLVTVSIVIVFVIAFVITMLVLNAVAKRIIYINTKLVELRKTGRKP